MNFIEIAELKTKLNIGKIDVVKSPKTSKLFASTIKQSTGEPMVFKVEQNIDFALPTKFMYETEDAILEGCFVNVTPTAPPVHSW